CKADDELSTDEAKTVLDDLVQFGVPSVLFSGGEPLMRPDLFELIGYAVERGMRAVISTNGTLITAEMAKRIKHHGVSYVGISLDGIGPVNDRFRGVSGAFERAVAGIKNCQDAGVRIGLRLTLTGKNVQDLESLFAFFEAKGIERACFYHFVPSGRGGTMADEDLTHAQTRDAVEMILAKTKHYKQAGRTTDILTVDNHVDGVYLYLKLRQEDPKRAEEVWKLLTWNGGGMYSSGVGIGCIDFHGKVHPDQFWWHYDLGDVRHRPFSQIWMDTSDPLLRGLKDRGSHIKGRCRLCQFFDACGGSLRVRADLHFGDPWAPDPACYLTDAEIGLDEEKQAELVRTAEIFQMPK
ncbi:MAG TPA: radical SAM protein, partial [Sedimentisphaerales bacterium]|nr:radical SAM protein [Sedimentisphaerales bacterium]